MVHIGHTLLHALRMTFAMFWEILWALILGFGLSGVVQALISKKEMSRLLLDDSPKNIIRATVSGCDRLPEADLSSPAGPVLGPPMHTWTNIILATLTIASNDLNSINHCEFAEASSASEQLLRQPLQIAIERGFCYRREQAPLGYAQRTRHRKPRPRLTKTLRAGYILKRIAYGACSCGYH
jgi:hypothetical protein